MEVILAVAISNLIDVVSLAVHAAKGRALREARLDCMQLSMEDGKVGLFDKKTQRKQKQLRFARAVSRRKYECHLRLSRIAVLWKSIA